MALEGFGMVEMVWIVPELNRRRYYRISVEAGLFGPILVRTWGRIGWKNLRRIEQFFPEGKLSEALEMANRMLAAKMMKGYARKTDTTFCIMRDSLAGRSDKHETARQGLRLT